MPEHFYVWALFITLNQLVMKDILNKLDWLGFDNYSQALIYFYKEPIDNWDLSELTEWELNILKLNYQVINN